MDDYILNTVDYNYTTLNHEGFGGVCKYIATPKRVGYSRLLVKHEKIQSACNAFMCSRLTELCDVYTPKAYLMSTTNETRRLFPMHPFIVGTEWVEDFSAVDYGSIKESPALRQQYLDSMALYAMFCRIADTPQFAFSPSEGVFAYDWDEAFDVTDFVIKLCLYNSDAGTEQLRRMLQHFSQHPFENEAELCLQSAAEHTLKFKSAFALRTECERYNSRFKATAQERLWVRNRHSVENLNTLAHISLLTIAAAAFVTRHP